MKTCPTCHIRYPDALEFCPQDGTALPGGAPGRTQHLYDRFVGTTVDGRYKIEAKLGEGGMGVVYAARHVIIDKRVAIKVLKREAQHDETAAQRFITEARATSRIGHANIVDITDFGQMPDGSAYFVMEFLEGRTLGQVIAEGPVQPSRAIRVASQMARGLQAAHKVGIIHRDLKPDNIFLLERDGLQDVVKIVDFGIAKVQTQLGPQRLTAAGMVLGTPEYMSPEQATGKDTDHRVDEYALGCILYEMLTGEVPFRGTNSAATLTKHVFEPVVPPRKRRPDLALPVRLEAIVLKAMAKKPDDRYPTMREVLDALDDAAADLGIPAEPVRGVSRGAIGAVSADQTLSRRRGRTKSRNTAVYALAGGAVVALGVGGVLALGHGGESTTAKREPASVVVPVHPAAPKAEPAPVAPAEAVIALHSHPSGAAVFVDDEKIGSTPCDYRHPRSAAPIDFVFKLSGYKDLTRTITPDASALVDVTLVKRHDRGHSSSSSSRSKPAPAPRTATPVERSGSKSSRSDLRDPFN